MSENEPTQLIEGRYRIVRNIAEGGMATVYEAVDERLGRTVAIKIMHTQLAQGPHRDQFVERFRREANSAAAIANPHIVQVYDTGEYNGLDFLVMEYVHGVNLRHEMNLQGTFSVRETVRVIAETLDGLAAAHRIGVVHRDIKPENILLNDRGHVQITDFGLAKAASQATLSSTGMLLGTAAYLAPEMIEHNQATPQGDLYSVGIMAWEMLTGKVPFDSDNPVTLVFKHVHEDVPPVSTVCTGIDPSIAAFVSHLTARQVEERPADGMTAAEELRQIAAKLPLEAWQYRLHAESEISDRTDATAPALVGRIGESVHPSHIADNPAPTSAMPPAPPAAPTTALETQAERTQVMGVAQSNALGDQPTDTVIPTEVHLDERSADQPSKHNRKPLIIALAVLLIVALVAGGGAWWWFAGPGSYWSVPQPEDVSCAADDTECALTGADWTTYESLLKTAGIPYTMTQGYSDTVAEGHVISASVDAADAYVGTHIGRRSDQQLTVVVSKGVRMVTIPSDILDATSTNGKDPLNALKKAGFDKVTHDSGKDDYSLDVPEGAALTISPDPGTTLKHNSEVTITLSKGPKPVTMPDVTDMTKDEVQSALEELNLTANITEEYDDKIAAGKVISTSQEAGTQLKWGDSVDVVISKGPETITLENYVGQKASTAKAALEKLGFTVSVESQITVDSSKDKTVASQNPVGGTVVRLRDANGNPTAITLKMYSSIF
ncbi:protein kinase domain-containing protein [Bifidobacterium scaligerum]|uniref:non-specific serine/threonine protein kinase n=1 Tax=Bifidobacterium scaligerum TaxID=2052656 RepID=A0A2M9HSC4_9BIFI|nr:PASTA domain-containing protein [Bifidobacterium scaligerum]PJM79721.1 serine/threonine protein kinase [Bifidobacterium scaligerum]